MTPSSTFSSRWTSSRARSSAMLDRSRSSSIVPLAPGEGGVHTAPYYANCPLSWQSVRAGAFSPEFLRWYRLPCAPQQGLIGGLLDECMLEHVRRLWWQPLLVQELRLDQLLQPTVQGPFVPRRDRLQQFVGKLAPQGGPE